MYVCMYVDTHHSSKWRILDMTNMIDNDDGVKGKEKKKEKNSFQSAGCDRRDGTRLTD